MSEIHELAGCAVTQGGSGPLVYAELEDGSCIRLRKESVTVGQDTREFAVADNGDDYYIHPRHNVLVAVRNRQTFLDQMRPDSHMEFLHAQQLGDPQAFKQTERRRRGLTATLQRMCDRETPTAGANIQMITDEKFFEYNKMWHDSVAAGESDNCDFRPFSLYGHKLIRYNVRKPFKGEIGYLRKRPGDDTEITILCIEQGYGEGTLVGVL